MSQKLSSDTNSRKFMTGANSIIHYWLELSTRICYATLNQHWLLADEEESRLLKLRSSHNVKRWPNHDALFD